MIVTTAVIFLVFFLLSWALVWLVYRYSEKHSVLDTPNERSSHTEPTATGGGLSISVCLIIGSFLLWTYGYLKEDLFLAVFPALVIISITGWIDVHNHIRTSYRAIIYFVSAMWVTIIVGGIDTLNMGGVSMNLGLFGYLLAILGIVWLTNLYNFMDGIDGLAAIQAITAGLAGGVFLLHSGMPGPAIFCLILVAAAAGYLLWNWPPAKIFMGDVGSCPLGFLFAVLVVWSHSNSGPTVYVWLILLSVFIADATYTLIMRLIRNDKWYSAHRSHAYQKLVQMGYTHKQVSIGVLILNIIVLWPAAYITDMYSDLAIYVTTFIYIILAMLWGVIQYRSGFQVTCSD